MRQACWILLFSVLALGYPLAAQPHEACPAISLPPQVQALLDHKFPKLRPKNLSDLGAYDKKLWLETHPRECPGIAVGHFESPSRMAYAILLVPKSGPVSEYKVVVLSKVLDKYIFRLLDHAEEGTFADSGLVTSKEPRGKYSDFGETRSVHVNVDAVNVEWLEKSSVLYYWSRGAYRSLPTSD